jgi:hypothetical protein
MSRCPNPAWLRDQHRCTSATALRWLPLGSITNWNWVRGKCAGLRLAPEVRRADGTASRCPSSHRPVVMPPVGRQVGVHLQNFETVWRAKTFREGMGPIGPRSTAMVGLSLAVLVLMTACGGSLLGISRQKAVALARVRAQQVSSTPVSLVRAASGPSGAFQTGTPRPHRMVWAVTFSGTFTPPSCGPAGLPPHTCPLSVHTVRIFLDAGSGAFIFGEYPVKTP